MKRKVLLDDKVIYLEGARPLKGSAIKSEFNIRPARGTRKGLRSADLNNGCVIISTLPNIEKHACMKQVLDLEHSVRANLKEARLVHVSSDGKIHWKDVDEFHPDLKAEAYTLDGISPKEREGFTQTFGVGVKDNKRIAHGIFGLKDGRIITSLIPRQQMGNPNVRVFVSRFKKDIKNAKKGASV